MKVIIAAGGTGGHVIPAQQLASILIKKKIAEDIFFAGKDLSSNQFMQKEKFSYIDISSSILSRKKAFSFLFKLTKGLFQSIKSNSG